MKIHSDRGSRLENLKRGYHKCLAYDIRRYINGWLQVYCKNTSLHGFRYITASGSAIIESVLWFAVCAASIVFCVTLMMRLWANYSRNPIATTIDTSNLIWDLPFPGVTICNNNKVYRPHADIIAKQLYTSGISVNESERFFSSLLKLIRPDKVSIDDVVARQVLGVLDMTVETLMNKLMQPCSALLVRCAWVGRIFDCNKIFKTVKSKDGFCCAFNFHFGLDDDYESTEEPEPETRYNLTRRNVTSNSLPGVHKILNAPGSGRDFGLAVVLNVDRYNYKGSVRPSVAASIFVHDAIDFPDIGAHSASVPPGHVLAISVTGTSIKSMNSLRALPVEKRSCYFDDEVSSESHYSFQSCVSECVAEQLLQDCGCLPFYYPQKHAEIRTCYLTDVECILAKRSTMPEEEGVAGNCRKCLPQCTDIVYSIDIEDIEMDVVGFETEITHGLDLHNMSLVYVFYGDISYVEYRKESILSWDGLLASFGGIFGLCLGGSVMSVIELLYLLAREFFKQRKTQEQSRKDKDFPPASELFLSRNPAEEIGKPRNHQQELDLDKRVYVTWYRPTVQRRKVTSFEDTHRKRFKF